MASKKSLKARTSSAKTGRSKSPDRTPSAAVTQSTRFDSAQLAEIKKACDAKGWSISQLILIATVEKAVAINQMIESRRAIRSVMENLVDCLLWRTPRMKVLGQHVPDPLLNEFGHGPSWEQHCPEYQYLSPGTDDEHTLLRYAHDSRCFSFFDDARDVDGGASFEFEPSPASPKEVDGIAKCIEAIGREFGPLLSEAYQDRLFKRDNETNATFRTAEDLMSGEPEAKPKGD